MSEPLTMDIKFVVTLSHYCRPFIRDLHLIFMTLCYGNDSELSVNPIRNDAIYTMNLDVVVLVDPRPTFTS